MVTRQPHHEHDDEDTGENPEGNARNRTAQDQLCGDVAAYVLDVLEPEQQETFARHLTGCERCQADAADFGVFAPALRECVRDPVPADAQCHVVRKLTRSMVMLAAGFVVAVVAVLSVVQSLSDHLDDPVEVESLIQAHQVDSELFSLFRHR